MLQPKAIYLPSAYPGRLVYKL